MTQQILPERARYSTCRYSATSNGEDGYAQELRQGGLSESYDCENPAIIEMSICLGKFPLHKVRQSDGSFKEVAELHHIQAQDTSEKVESHLEKICSLCEFYQPKSK